MKIRKRERRGHVKEAGGYTSWTEWQVVTERGKVLARFDTEPQAERFVYGQTESAEIIIFPGIPKVKT